MKTELKELSVTDIEMIKDFFTGIFTKEPWNDDWSDKNQLHKYILGLIGNQNSLTFGFYADGEMVGLSMGNIRYWYSGTEYYIDEYCVKTDLQGKGLGTKFLGELLPLLKSKGMCQIFLQTNRDVPAYKFYKNNGFIELDRHVSLVKDF